MVTVLPLKVQVALSPARFLPADVENLPPNTPTAPANERDGRGDRSSRMSTTRERAEQKRQEKLELVREQVDSGSLVIRKMTDEERRRYPARPAQPRRFAKR